MGLFSPFNRTIVELKHVVKNNSRTCQLSFNRTIVELKQNYHYFSMFHFSPFNRTIVELKHPKTVEFRQGKGTFNRTIVELKREFSLTLLTVEGPLIEPLWN